MAVEWQSRDFLTDWTGLFNRRQSVDVPPSYARTVRNVDFFGSAIGKRQGTQIVNGWASLASGAWDGSVPGQTQGTVLDATGFQVNDNAIVVNPGAGVIGFGTVYALSGSLVTLAPYSGTLPTQNTSAIVVRRDMGGIITGLYHAVFRDGSTVLVAAAGGTLFNVWGTPVGNPVGSSYAPVVMITNFPQTTIAADWATATSGTIVRPDTLVAADHSTYYQRVANSSASSPDIIQIVHAGAVIYEGTIAGFSGATVPPVQTPPAPYPLPPYTITLTNPASFPPRNGDAVIFFPHGYPSDARFTMLNNRVYVAFAGGANTVKSGAGPQANQRQPPVVLEQSAPGNQPYVRRMGVRAPTLMPFVYGNNPGSGNLNGQFSYRYTYVNGLNGQESEGSPPTTPPINIGPAVPNQSISVPVKASPDPQVSGINIYRTLSNNDGAWYLVNSTPLSNADQTYTDNVADSALGQLLKTFSNETPPDSITMFAVWTQAGALVAIDSGAIAEGGEQVAWSDAPDIVNGVYKCESFPVNNTLFVNRDDGDHLVSVGAFYDSAVVWKGRSMHRIVGAPPDIILQPISFRDDQTGVGIWSAKGFIMDTDVAIFVSDDGFYQVSRYEGVQQGFTSSRISRPIDEEFRTRTTVGVSAQRVNRELSHLCYDRAQRKLHAFVPVDGYVNSTDQFVYQLEGTVEGVPHGWAEWSVPIDYAGNIIQPPPAASANFVSASCIVEPMTGMDHPYYACGGLGLVVKADVGAGEWQSLPVTYDYATVWFSAGGAGTVTRGRALDYVFVFVAATAAGVAPPIHMTIGQDYVGFDDYALPLPAGAIAALLNRPLNVNTVFLSLAQYHSLEMSETSVRGLFRILDFTFWFQRLPVGVVPRLVATPQTGAYVPVAPWSP